MSLRLPNLWLIPAIQIKIILRDGSNILFAPWQIWRRMERLSNGPTLGQLLIIGFDGTEMSPRLASLLTKIQPAGVILFARNITGAEQTHRLLRECQKCVATPLFTCVDLEGGQVDRFRNVLGPAPSAAEVFATGDRKLFRKHGRVIGENCRALGFNVDFAPVLDLRLRLRGR